MICSNAALLDFLKIENVAFSGDAFFLSALWVILWRESKHASVICYLWTLFYSRVWSTKLNAFAWEASKPKQSISWWKLSLSLTTEFSFDRFPFLCLCCWVSGVPTRYAPCSRGQVKKVEVFEVNFQGEFRFPEEVLLHVIRVLLVGGWLFCFIEKMFSPWDCDQNERSAILARTREFSRIGKLRWRALGGCELLDIQPLNSALFRDFKRTEVD